VSEAIRHLSHDLHPAVLQHAGLVAAVRGSCTEFGTIHGIETVFHAGDGLEQVPADAALCLYRVAQEVLHNIGRHAGAHRVEVTLTSSDENGLELRIADDGCGFDVAESRRACGLGLISIDERVRLIGGRVQIRSERGHGTELRVRVPVRVPEATSGEDQNEPGDGVAGRGPYDRRKEPGPSPAG
jgi:signal transduction histidine kinase